MKNIKINWQGATLYFEGDETKELAIRRELMEPNRYYAESSFSKLTPSNPPTPTGLKLIRTRTEEVYVRPEAIESIYRIEHTDGEATSLVYFHGRSDHAKLNISPSDLIAQLEAGK